MSNYARIRRYKGFELHPIEYGEYGKYDRDVRWQICWLDKHGTACSMAGFRPSIAAAQRAINALVNRGVKPYAKDANDGEA